MIRKNGQELDKSYSQVQRLLLENISRGRRHVVYLGPGYSGSEAETPFIVLSQLSSHNLPVSKHLALLLCTMALMLYVTGMVR